jgi:hypothetical protein
MKLRLSGLRKDATTDLVAPITTERTFIDIDCQSLIVSIERRIQRTVVRGGEGDDLLDEGAESAVYDAVAVASMDQYADIMSLFRGSAPMIDDPFGEGVVRVAFKSLSFDGRLVKMTLIEDIE